MAETRSMTRNHNHDDVSIKKMSKTFDKFGWSDLNDDMLFLVMMQLGIIDFLSFSGVCKSWRSFAHSNKKLFTESRPPMLLWISDRPYKKECYLEDFEKRKYKTLLPHSGGRECVGLTCGYLVLFSKRTKDFTLVNPITKNVLHFPSYFSYRFTFRPRAILVFSAELSGWVFAFLDRDTHRIKFSIAGKGSWGHVSSTVDICDLLLFKGKIYALTTSCCVCELRLYPQPKLMILKTKNYLKKSSAQQFVSSGENLYVGHGNSRDSFTLVELDLVEMKWVCHENDKEEYLLFKGLEMQIAALKSKFCADHWPRCKGYVSAKKGEMDCMWYFLDDCFNVNIVDGC